MTDLLTRDPNDSGEIRLHPSIVDTERIEVGEGTQDLTHTAANLRRPAAHPESAHDTGEIPLWPTGAELAVAAEQSATATLLAAAVSAPPAEYPAVRTVVPPAEKVLVRGRRRGKGRAPLTGWQFWVATLMLALLGGILGGAVMMAYVVAVTR